MPHTAATPAGPSDSESSAAAPPAPGSAATPGPAAPQAGSDAAPTTEPPALPRPPVRRGESQRDIERGILRWMFVFFFATHLIGGVIWLAIYLSGKGGN